LKHRIEIINEEKIKKLEDIGFIWDRKKKKKLSTKDGKIQN